MTAQPVVQIKEKLGAFLLKASNQGVTVVLAQHAMSDLNSDKKKGGDWGKFTPPLVHDQVIKDPKIKGMKKKCTDHHPLLTKVPKYFDSGKVWKQSNSVVAKVGRVEVPLQFMDDYPMVATRADLKKGVVTSLGFQLGENGSKAGDAITVNALSLISSPI